MSAWWSTLAPASPDPVMGLVAAFKEDKAASKVNLAQGAYRTGEGKPFVLPVVRLAEKRVVQDTTANKEYLPIEGLPEFRKLTAEFLLGKDSPALAAGKVATLQTLSGTGSLRLAGQMIKQFGPGVIYLPTPTWANHAKIFQAAGLQVKYYRYLSAKLDVDVEGMVEDLSKLPAGTPVLLHTCAHNPTGVDPSRAEWQRLAELFKQKGLIPVFDGAYQGYATGDVDADAFAVRYFERQGIQLIACQSYAKNMGLYGERIGALVVVCSSPKEAAIVLGQIKQAIIRPMYSTPPTHGARLVSTILKDADLRAQWDVELKTMANRIKEMRAQLVAELKKAGAPGNWDGILTQIGMFAWTGLSQAQVQRLRTEHHIYMTKDGRVSVAGMTPKDAPVVARAIATVLTTAPASRM